MTELGKKRLILASNSPRRRELLGLSGLSFDVQVADVDESLLPGESAEEYVRRLALKKSATIAEKKWVDAVIIGSDTTVVLDGVILGKPATPADARVMLLALANRTHQVYTGIAATNPMSRNSTADVVVTEVPMRDYTEREIIQYIETGDPMDKAGAYGIQNSAFSPVVNMGQCYASVMGLPVCSVSNLLKQFSVDTEPGVEKRCQNYLKYNCPVYQKYL